jgi:3-hydroxy acid dehydrogenase/malonic semialdehyde reductase
VPNLSSKIALITGATSGIGAACARTLAEAGASVILVGRRADRLQSLAQELTQAGHKALTQVLDVRNPAAVSDVLQRLPEAWRAIDILINNAGLAKGLEPLQEGKIEDWDQMIDTNIKGLLYMSRAILPGMVLRNCGHVVNIGSIAGHEVYPNGGVYCATKHAVRALNQAMRLDVMGTTIRVSTIDPGMVETDFSLVRFDGNADRADQTYQKFVPLQADDVADAVLYVLTRPAHVDVQEMLLMPTQQASATRHHAPAGGRAEAARDLSKQ